MDIHFPSSYQTLLKIDSVFILYNDTYLVHHYAEKIIFISEKFRIVNIYNNKKQA